MFDFLFKKEPNDAQMYTAYVLAAKVYKNMFGYNSKDAERLAYRTVMQWIDEDKLDTALRNLWQKKVA